MFEYLISTSPVRERALERRGLTPNDARALWSLEPGAPRPIGSLAREWACDPANATFIIGRLEAAGLAQRRASDDDRRVKLVDLTAKGVATKRALLREYCKPPAAFQRLSRADHQTLLAILARLARDASADTRTRPARP
jgi:DNA-binding MarR family transcriptional regulator